MEETRKIKHELDVQLIGSDISIRAIETSTKNIEFANLDSYQGLFKHKMRPVINDPMIFSEHWPKQASTESSSLINFEDV